MLLSSLENYKREEKNDETNKIEEAFTRIKNAGKWSWQRIFFCKKTRSKTNEANDGDSNHLNGFKFLNSIFLCFFFQKTFIITFKAI
jgi:hypothetical protein